LVLRRSNAFYKERGIKPRRIEGNTNLLGLLSRFSTGGDAMVVVRPETVIRWHRTRIDSHSGGWKSRPGPPPRLRADSAHSSGLTKDCWFEHYASPRASRHQCRIPRNLRNWVTARTLEPLTRKLQAAASRPSIDQSGLPCRRVQATCLCNCATVSTSRCKRSNLGRYAGLRGAPSGQSINLRRPLVLMRDDGTRTRCAGKNSLTAAASAATDTPQLNELQRYLAAAKGTVTARSSSRQS